MSNQILCRAPIGFVVEGHGEYNCYPSLVHRIVKTQGFQVPRSNAGGCGGIYRKLRIYLTNLVLTYHPYSVIVTVDLKDAIKRKIAKNCLELLEILNSQVSIWQSNDALNDQRLQPLPEKIVVVIQIQKFETWILSDISSLEEAGHVRLSDEKKREIAQFGNNVDELVSDPASWLKKCKTASGDIKNVKYARLIVGFLNPEVMLRNSRSFQKFHKEVDLAYRLWCTACGIE